MEWEPVLFMSIILKSRQKKIISHLYFSNKDNISVRLFQSANI